MFTRFLIHLWIQWLLLKSVCTRHPLPVISEDSMQNSTILIGQDVELRCKVADLGRHKVAFARAGQPPRLISFDEKIFRNVQKYELRPRGGPQTDEWTLVIRNAKEEDRGNYTCQVNTDPVISKIAQIELKIPPSVSRNNPSAVEVREGHNVTLNCKAEGTPEPSVIWRRADRQIIRFNGATGYGATIHKGPQLHLIRVSRKHMAEYVCVASNGIPPDESWTVRLMVTFPPLVLAKHSTISARRGAVARLVCDVESWPRPEVSWERDGNVLFDSDHIAISQIVSQPYHTSHILEIRKVEPTHYGSYRCIAKNENGHHQADIYLQPDPDYEGNHVNSGTMEGSGRLIESDLDETGGLNDDEDTSNRINEMEGMEGRDTVEDPSNREEDPSSRNIRRPIIHQQQTDPSIRSFRPTELKQEQPSSSRTISLIIGLSVTIFSIICQ